MIFIGVYTKTDVMRQLIDINCIGVSVLTQAYIQCIREYNDSASIKGKRGISITSSIAGKVGSPYQNAYSMSKHGVNGFFDSLRFELINDNIFISIICPGPFDITKDSFAGIGNNMNQDSGRLNKKKESSKLSLNRLSELYISCIVYYLTESWISKHPVLLFAYLNQYIPSIKWLLIGIVSKMRKKDIIHKQE